MNKFLAKIEGAFKKADTPVIETGKVVADVAKDTPKVLIDVAKAAPIIADVAEVAFPMSAPIAAAISTVSKITLTGESMNTLEAFAITQVLGILQAVVKNPAHKAALQNQLVGVATDIFVAYGMTVPASSGTPTATA